MTATFTAIATGVAVLWGVLGAYLLGIAIADRRETQARLQRRLNDLAARRYVPITPDMIDTESGC